MMSAMIRITLLVLIFLLWGRSSDACQIPVFRYALERWPSDSYRAVVFHRGPLDAALQKELSALSEAAGDGSRPNVEIASVDLAAGDPAPELQSLWTKQKDASLPWLVLEYPERGAPVRLECWAGSLDTDVTRALRTSPARDEIAKKLRGGDSAVWVFLESGDAEKDSAARTVLETELKKLQKSLKLPDLESIVNDASYVPNNKIELRLSFSTIQVSRKDVAERLFIEMLLGTEDDLREYNEPLAFPIFGRGRILWPLIGRGINRGTIRDACLYLTGACSCQVKDENPGIDILMAAPWETWVGKSDGELRQPETDPSDAIDLILASLPDPATEATNVETDAGVSEVAQDVTDSPETSSETAAPPVSTTPVIDLLTPTSSDPPSVTPTETRDSADDGPLPAESKRRWPLIAMIVLFLAGLGLGHALLRRAR
jgi:hypothetical protein